jgi:DNA-binding HxlR family transcriptional regulator
VDALLRLLMGSWTTYILWHLRQDGPLRFGALRRAIPGISSKVLTQRLRMLEEYSIIYRHHVPSIPPEVSYGLTEQGRELGGVLNALEDVSRRWLARGWLEGEGRNATTSPSPSPPASRLGLRSDDR